MKRQVLNTNSIGHGLADAATIEKRRKQQKMLKELGLLVPYDSKTMQLGTESSQFSKYYRTEEEYIKDKAKANLLIYSGEDIPQELYTKLAYTKQELGNC
ncbi:MAG: hypothetical protein IJX86_12985 [Lachnospiraceae bacterium]|nr:hypothetical protein [Lachnospiraceae bacterium]